MQIGPIFPKILHGRLCYQSSALAGAAGISPNPPAPFLDEEEKPENAEVGLSHHAGQMLFLRHGNGGFQADNARKDDKSRHGNLSRHFSSGIPFQGVRLFPDRIKESNREAGKHFG